MPVGKIAEALLYFVLTSAIGVSAASKDITIDDYDVVDGYMQKHHDLQVKARPEL
ncbi:MAG: hypothetical protein ACK5N8_07610 [Alphaproteobacteria bacterium]